jgi:hypothetical protein
LVLARRLQHIEQLVALQFEHSVCVLSAAHQVAFEVHFSCSRIVAVDDDYVQEAAVVELDSTAGTQSSSVAGHRMDGCTVWREPGIALDLVGREFAQELGFIVVVVVVGAVAVGVVIAIKLDRRVVGEPVRSNSQTLDRGNCCVRLCHGCWCVELCDVKRIVKLRNLKRWFGTWLVRACKSK